MGTKSVNKDKKPNSCEQLEMRTPTKEGKASRKVDLVVQNPKL